MTSISKTTLDFLNALKLNNNREWFNDHKTEFQKEQKKAKDFYNAILDQLKTHDAIEGVKMFRIYRDVRFSLDKTPYKPHFAGSFSKATKKLRGGYYLRIRVSDKPGVLAEITKLFGDKKISIDAMLQKEPKEYESEADIVILSHLAVEKDINVVIHSIESLSATIGNVIKIRLEELSK